MSKNNRSRQLNCPMCDQQLSQDNPAITLQCQHFMCESCCKIHFIDVGAEIMCISCGLIDQQINKSKIQEKASFQNMQTQRNQKQEQEQQSQAQNQNQKENQTQTSIKFCYNCLEYYQAASLTHIKCQDQRQSQQNQSEIIENLAIEFKQRIQDIQQEKLKCQSQKESVEEECLNQQQVVSGFISQSNGIITDLILSLQQYQVSLNQKFKQLKQEKSEEYEQILAQYKETINKLIQTENSFTQPSTQLQELSEQVKLLRQQQEQKMPNTQNAQLKLQLNIDINQTKQNLQNMFSITNLNEEIKDSSQSFSIQQSYQQSNNLMQETDFSLSNQYQKPQQKCFFQTGFLYEGQSLVKRVSPLKPLNQLTHKHAELLKFGLQIQELSQQFSHYRESRGDGNCYYRAVGFG